VAAYGGLPVRADTALIDRASAAGPGRPGGLPDPLSPGAHGRLVGAEQRPVPSRRSGRGSRPGGPRRDRLLLSRSYLRVGIRGASAAPCASWTAPCPQPPVVLDGPPGQPGQGPAPPGALPRDPLKPHVGADIQPALRSPRGGTRRPAPSRHAGPLGAPDRTTDGRKRAGPDHGRRKRAGPDHGAAGARRTERPAGTRRTERPGGRSPPGRRPRRRDTRPGWELVVSLRAG
jgi:hypothetical protein